MSWRHFLMISFGNLFGILHLIQYLKTLASTVLHQWSNQLKLTKDVQPTLVVIYDKLLLTTLFLSVLIRRFVNWGYQATSFCDVLALELPG